MAVATDNDLRAYLEDAFEHVDWEALQPIVGELAAKSDRFRAVLGNPAARGRLTLSALQPILGEIFVARRHRREIVHPANHDVLPAAVADLLHGDAPPGRRIGDFLRRLDVAHQGMGVELATELLHFSAPDRHWLWSRWLYDANAGTGVLPLLLEGGRELGGSSLEERYLAVGRAIALVGEVEDARRLLHGALASRPEHQPFAVDVFLAAAWGSYLYGITAWRLTREFHKVLPPLPRLVRRLFGLIPIRESQAGRVMRNT